MDTKENPTPANAQQPQPASSADPIPSPAPPPQHKGKPMMWVIALLILSLICVLFFAAWYFQSQSQKAAPIEQKQNTVSKTLIIGTDATFQPMEYTSPQDELIGYDIDLGNRIAEELGTKAEFKIIIWDNLFTALENKEIDMIMSSVTITDERKKTYDFSDSYLNAGQVIITRKDNSSISSAENLQGKRIAVQEKTTNEEEALKYTSTNLVIRFPDFEKATKALVDGNVDAILSDLPGAKGIVTANPTLKISSDPFTNDYYGIVFRKNDTNVEKINQALSVLRTKGVLTDLKQKWLD